jgi:hypothetical protein
MSAHGPWAAELSTFEKYAKGWLVALFGIPPAAVLVALEGARVQLPTWALALLAILPVVAATAGVVSGPANKVPLTPIGPPILASTAAPLPTGVTAEQLPDVPPAAPLTPDPAPSPVDTPPAA